MDQNFRHVLRGVDAAEVEAYVAQHRRRWWQQRQLVISVHDGRIRAGCAPTANTMPPVLHGTVTPGPGGAVLEGTLTRRGETAVSAAMWCAVAVLIMAAVVVLVGGGTLWLVLALAASAAVLAAVDRSSRRLQRHPELQEGEANLLRGELDVFFGLRERR